MLVVAMMLGCYLFLHDLFGFIFISLFRKRRDWVLGGSAGGEGACWFGFGVCFPPSPLLLSLLPLLFVFGIILSSRVDDANDLEQCQCITGMIDNSIWIRTLMRCFVEYPWVTHPVLFIDAID